MREIDAELAEYDGRRGGHGDAARASMRRGAARLAGRGRRRASPQRYRDGELDVLDLVRHYGVILDWGTGELLPKTTVTFREMLQRRSASHWPPPPPSARPMNRDRDLRWAEHPVVIVVAPTGAEVTREHNPAVPYTPAEIAADVAACHAAGAAVAHLHVREADGTPSAERPSCSRRRSTDPRGLRHRHDGLDRRRDGHDDRAALDRASRRGPT